MKNQVCCFTVHRIMKMPKSEIIKRLDEVIDYLVSKGVIYYGCGGALGFDTLAAEAVIRARNKNPNVKLILVLPCKDQDKKWNDKDKEVYSYIKSQADKIRYISDEYTSTCMHDRNRHMVNESSVCIAFLERNSGGTYYTFKYAREKELVIYNLSCDDYMLPTKE